MNGKLFEWVQILALNVADARGGLFYLGENFSAELK
jgi:hypothetical protein